MRLNCQRLAAALMCVAALCALALAQKQSKKNPPAAQDLINSAVSQAKAENKTVFVHFGASWCGWCKRLDAMLQAPAISKLITDHYVLVSLTVQETREQKGLETPGAEEVMSKMGGREAGLPFYFFLDQTGAKLADSMVLADGDNIGYPASAEEIAAFAQLLERTAPRMTAAQRAQITDYLTTHAPR